MAQTMPDALFGPVSSSMSSSCASPRHTAHSLVVIVLWLWSLCCSHHPASVGGTLKLSAEP